MARLIWAEHALAQLEDILGFIAQDNPTAAKKLGREVWHEVNRLPVFPRSGARPAELTGTIYRRVSIRPILVYYRVEKEDVIITYVRRGESRFSLDQLEENED
ncbi:MAG: type II toxin-antitoxin system RelE/ParE family toxin [Verrucomicrobiota bacterium JB022]|nr:type II toxin-antitoxin system RelE/ParE family toxin [Verrucomicrobiota bacterium JB022]